jgi:hypothetical protein
MAAAAGMFIICAIVIRGMTCLEQSLQYELMYNFPLASNGGRCVIFAAAIASVSVHQHHSIAKGSSLTLQFCSFSLDVK